MLMSMSEDKIVTWRFETYSATGGRVLNEVDVDADVAEALDRGEAVTTFRPHAHRRFEGEEAEERIRAWLDGFRSGS
jgi:hypothetical protein